MILGLGRLPSPRTRSHVYQDIPQRLARVRESIADAASRAGRSPADVRLIAVSKTHPIDAVRAAAEAGQVDFGENKVQEALQKIAQSTDTRLRWHLIGHLQSNKAKKAAGAAHAIHAIDSVDLLKKVDQAAAAAGPHHPGAGASGPGARRHEVRRPGSGFARYFPGSRQLPGRRDGGADAAAAAGRKPGRRAALVCPAARRSRPAPLMRACLASTCANCRWA